MAEEDTSNTGDDTGSEDTSNEGDAESGGVTQEEVAAALRGTGIVLPEEPKAPAEDDDSEEDTTDDADTTTDAETDDASEDATTEEDTPAETPTKPVTEAAAEAAAEEAPDFSLEVVDADGVTHKISSIADLPEDFTPQNNRQILEVLDDLRTLQDQKRTYENDQEIKAEDAARTEAVQAIQDQWANEFKTLNITDDTRQSEIMEFMSKENDKREAAGQPLIRTVEHAQLSLEKQEAATAKADAAKAAKDTSRKNGALVGGSSAPASAPATAYVAGSARNANEAIRAMGLL